MTANDNKCYLLYLNKLVDQYNNTYHYSINRKPINADYSALTENANEVVKNTKFNTLKTKVNSLKKKFPDVTTIISMNQYNTDKRNLQKKDWRC